MKSIISILTLCLSVIALSGPLSAFGANDPGSMNMSNVKSALNQACKSDLKKYCSDVTPGQGRPMACLKAHEDKLSSSCTQQWNQAKAQIKSKIQQFRTACAGDVQKFCGGAMGPRDIGSCLSDHETDLSASCKNLRDQMKMTG